MNKVAVLLRTYNEELNINKFYSEYEGLADLVLVADGGSTDSTIELIKSLPKAKVRSFTERVKLLNEYSHNPESKHINFLIEWAEEEGVDWVIFDDCDTTPNYLLKQEGRSLIEKADYAIEVTQVFFWEADQWFPSLSKSVTGWNYNLWAWKLDTKIRAFGGLVHYGFAFDEKRTMKLDPPYCRLHRAWPTHEILRKKVDRYKDSGLIPYMCSPIYFGGSLEPLPEWARNE